MNESLSNSFDYYGQNGMFPQGYAVPYGFVPAGYYPTIAQGNGGQVEGHGREVGNELMRKILIKILVLNPN